MSKRNLAENKEQLNSITCVLFDLDGTLIDTVDLIYKSFDYAVTTVLGQSLPKNKLLQNMGRPLLVQMECFSAGKADELIEAYNRHNLAAHDKHVKAYPYAAAVLSWLKREKKMKIGVVTSKKKTLATRGLKITGLRDFVDLVIAMEDTTHHKPNPEPVLKAIRILKCRPDKTLFIGDSPFDLAAGRRAGTTTGAAFWGPFMPDDLRALNPDIEMSDISELKKWF